MTMRMSARAKFFLYLFLIFMVILTVIPLLYTVSASFKTNMEIATGRYQPDPEDLHVRQL